MWNEDTYRLTLSVRDPLTPEKYLGDDAQWQLAEATLEKVAVANNLKFEREEGEAAFYGPKLDFKFKDAIGREWQLATAQLDYQMPGRFGLEYTANDGSKKTPVMIHRAIAGSLERFMSVMIEHFAGAFPFWMAPTQVRILPIKETHEAYAKEVFEKLNDAGYRVELTTADDGFGKRVREGKVQKVPYQIVIGDKEVEGKIVTLENRDEEGSTQITVADMLTHFEKHA
jgi:threonyl-tRNA synthetase